MTVEGGGGVLVDSYGIFNYRYTSSSSSMNTLFDILTKDCSNFEIWHE
jgi:hypothetical protein